MVMPANLGELIAAYRPSAIPLQDYRVQDDGAGPYIAYWNVAAMGAPAPTEAQVLTFKAGYDANTSRRAGQFLLASIVDEWTTAMMVNQRFGDNTRLLAVNAKIDAWKAAHPGVIP